MDRCWLKGAEGDALHAVLCAAGFNIRWLLRAIARLGLPGLLLAFFGLTLYAANSANRSVPLPRVGRLRPMAPRTPWCGIGPGRQALCHSSPARAWWSPARGRAVR